MRLQRLERSAECELVVHLADDLRLTGGYHRLRSRACEKRLDLEAAGWLNLSVADVGLTEADLVEQYFAQCLGRPVPTRLRGICGASWFPGPRSVRTDAAPRIGYQKLTGLSWVRARSGLSLQGENCGLGAAT